MPENPGIQSSFKNHNLCGTDSASLNLGTSLSSIGSALNDAAHHLAVKIREASEQLDHFICSGFSEKTSKFNLDNTQLARLKVFREAKHYVKANGIRNSTQASSDTQTTEHDDDKTFVASNTIKGRLNRSKSELAARDQRMAEVPWAQFDNALNALGAKQLNLKPLAPVRVSANSRSAVKNDIPREILLPSSAHQSIVNHSTVSPQTSSAKSSIVDKPTVEFVPAKPGFMQRTLGAISKSIRSLVRLVSRNLRPANAYQKLKD
ncbi:MAG TPA: hypothetical protein VFX23_00300 [Limnobacter sp.]|uniref:hypothetical protein n=1 Tax=Limnobacter sp. TaxID=2003368 RepID=UPI002E34B3BA|nr:hypothetical protein [Limnobacter sp.]HEX5484411.1 hypothetical protein [Limnobacter sp.]